MDIRYIAGFGLIGPSAAATFDFWARDLGLDMEEIAPDYHHAVDLDWARVFALWPLEQAAQSTFGTADWPDDLPRPQAWIEAELGSPEEVAAAADELTARGHRILAAPHEEPWGQHTARLLTPEGLLLGLSYMPPFHPHGSNDVPREHSPQRIPMLARYEEQIRSGEKLQTIRVDGPFATGRSVLVLEEPGASTRGADAIASGERTLIPIEVMSVRRTTLGELTDADAQADGYPDVPSFMAALRGHRPDAAEGDTVDVVAYRLLDRD